jgi:acyl-CoA synthetase (NDP forming)/GNAT superfamily N-acetyltransferase
VTAADGAAGSEETEETLRDGRVVTARPLRAADRAGVEAMWRRLDAPARRRFTDLAHLAGERAGEVALPRPGHAAGIIATTPAGSVAGVARYERTAGDTAGFVVFADASWRRAGLGTVLVRRLAEAARHAGVRRLAGDLPEGDVAMRGVLAELGLEYTERVTAAAVHASFAVQETDAYLDAVLADQRAAARIAAGPFLRPGSIALVGASDTPASVGQLLLANLLESGFAGPVYPVTPRHQVIRIARRISRHQPVVAVKAGRTGAGRRAASSHTAALAAGETAVEALFHQAGVIRAGTLEEMFDVAAVPSAQPVPAGRRVAVLTNGGGPGILVADACEAAGLLVPELSDDTQAALRAGLLPQASVRNPVDTVASATAEQYGQALRQLGAAEEIDAIIAVYIPAFVPAEDVAREIAAATATLPATPVVAVFLMAGPRPACLSEAGIPVFTYPEEAAAALGPIARWAEWRARPAGHVVTPPGIGPGAGRGVVSEVLAGQPGGGWASAEAAAGLLAAYGIPAVRSRLVRTPAEAAAAQAELGGPVAVKVAAAIHKSDVGGVAVGRTTPQAAADAVTAIRARLSGAGLAGQAAEFLVQEQIRDGVEMIIGVTHDPSFGPLVLAGLGGTAVEVLGDVAVRITPLSDTDVDEMLHSLRSYRLLTGYRQSPPLDVAAFAELLHRVSAMVEDIPEIAELDLNPVFVRPHGAVVADARVRLTG